MKYLSFGAVLVSLVLVGGGCAGSAGVRGEGGTEAQPAPSAQAPAEQPAAQDDVPKVELATQGDTDVTLDLSKQVGAAIEANADADAALPAAKKTIFVTAKNWEFQPAEIRVKKGDSVVMNITSVDVDHGLMIPEFKVSAELKPGVTTTVSFTADKTGTFAFFCNVYCGQGHRDMRGTLIVEESPR